MSSLTSDFPNTGVEVIYKPNTGECTSRITTVRVFKAHLMELELEDIVTGKEGRPIFFL